MSKNENDFVKKLLETFKIEANEHVNSISSGLNELEKTSTNERQMEIIEMIFREAHSLKGAARAVNMRDIEVISQSLESVFAALKCREISPSAELFDVLYQAIDVISKLLLSAEVKPTPSEKSIISKTIKELERSSKGVSHQLKHQELKKKEIKGPITTEIVIGKPLVEEKPVIVETVRLSTAKLNSLLLQAEELLSAKLTAGQRAAELREINTTIAIWKKQWSKIRAGARTVQQSLDKDIIKRGEGNSERKKNSEIVNLLEFLEWNSSLVKSLESKLSALAKSTEKDHQLIGAMVQNLLDDMKKVLMLPCSLFLQFLPKLVRDLSQDQGKEVELVIQGGEFEIDKRILDEMREPLIHVIRNCIDHGIEKPKEREQKKKSPRGMITVTISPKNSDKVEILISDDGAGIDLAKVRSAALRIGIISHEEAEKINEQQVLSLIFESGLSTSSIITDVSGRGLGLAILREKVEKLGGIVYIETHLDMGTTIRIILQSTLAIFRGVLVNVGEQLFVFPTTNVDRVVRLKKEAIKTVENRETIQLGDQAVSLVWLEYVLGLLRKSRTGDSIDALQVVVIGLAEKRIAFIVDKILDEQEVLVKNLGKQLSRIPNITSATVLGGGRIALILNVTDLMKSAAKVTTAAQPRIPLESEELKQENILVVEDSITARTLLKNILGAAGYDVKTAVDGVDAFTVLRTEDFDLVVSDVDMPRMNGFDLTARIRADKKLSELPVVLVTALESREDRERGIDVGANAYIVKSSFDQSNLLEVIKRLI